MTEKFLLARAERIKKECNGRFSEAVITEVALRKNGDFTITTDKGWSLWIDKKYGVTPKTGDTIITYPEAFKQIQGIKISNKVLFYKTDEQMEKERLEWMKKTRKQYEKEYIELMAKIKDEEPFETVDISGMGSGYERECQLMLRAGMKFLEEHPEFHFDYEQSPHIIGVCTTDTPWGKELDKALLKASPHQTGAMHQWVINHLQYIHKHGYQKWLEQFPNERRYMYPLELPKPAFGKER